MFTFFIAMQNSTSVHYAREVKYETYEKIKELYKWILEWTSTNYMVIFLAEKLKELVEQDNPTEINRCLEELKKYCSHWDEQTQISWLKERNVMDLSYLQSKLEKYAWAKHCENIMPPMQDWFIKLTKNQLTEILFINAYWGVKIKLMEFKWAFERMWLHTLYMQIENAFQNDRYHALLQLLMKAKILPQLSNCISEDAWNSIEILVHELMYTQLPTSHHQNWKNDIHE